ncbi:hypothetical protein U9M48_029489 [Paspalum notatum var. saurae]|uniref:Ionotropic glutamate receptor C-terminal domain-containing protein n=1 Tax=Paspalum notatum var. saurae TaxID=547442 RepID=A0AAQ3TYQ7_PASNO
MAALVFSLVLWSSEPAAAAAAPLSADDQLAINDRSRVWSLDDISDALENFYSNHLCNSMREDPADTKRIAVPLKHGFKNFVTFAISVFKNATMEHDIDIPYELCAFDGSYDELITNVSKEVFDGAVGDVTITSDRLNQADFTVPYQGNPAYQGSSGSQLTTASYFAFSTLTFSHGQIIRSPLSKIVVVMWCFAVLVLVQSYTANLSSMLTVKGLRPSVTSLDQLKRNNSYIGYQEGTFVRSYLLNRGVKRDRLISYGSQTEYAEALKNGSVSAIADETPYLAYFLTEEGNKDQFEMGECLSDTPGFAFVFPRNSLLVHNFSMAILSIIAGQDFPEVEQNWFGFGPPSVDDSSSVNDPTALTLESFSGLFVITGCISACMLLISVTKSVYAKYSRLRGSEQKVEDWNGEHEYVVVELNDLQNDRDDNASASNQGLGDVGDNHSHGDHGSGGDENAGGSMQDSMHSGSAAEVGVQTEMRSSSTGYDRRLDGSSKLYSSFFSSSDSQLMCHSGNVASPRL